MVRENSVVITLLNTRSYNKHKDDIKSDRVLMESDVICLTETQIPLNSHCNTNFDSFTIIPNNNMDRFSSLLIAYQQTVYIYLIFSKFGSNVI